MEQNGFTVIEEDAQDLAAIRTRYGIPAELQSCHIAIVDGYVIEGHVPVEEIFRLLDERPDIVGLAVAGMPPGAPGMSNGTSIEGPFDVIAFDREGRTQVFARYP